MEHRLLLILMSCGVYCVIGTLNPYKHIFVNQPKTFAEAQQYCRDNYNDLLTLRDQAGIEEVFAQENFGSTQFAWIGLKQSSQYQWHWALTINDFNQEYSNWGPHEPTNTPGEYCSVMDAIGDIRDTMCGDERIFICYNGRQNTASKYILVNTTKSWREAQRYCRQLYTDLACVRNRSENLEIQKLVPAQEVAYIGLYRDPYVWSDNSPSPFRNWDSGQPAVTGQCVVQQLQTPRLWADQPCSSQHPFLCQSLPVLKQVLRLEVKLDENVKVNDPDVKAALLQVIQQKLTSLGMLGQTHLWWRQQADGSVFQRTQQKAGAPPRAVRSQKHC